MDPRKTPEDEIAETAAREAGLESPDWDDLAGAELDASESAPDASELDDVEVEDGDLPEEEDDNSYQHSDAALPDDEEERAIARRLAHHLAEPDAS